MIIILILFEIFNVYCFLEVEKKREEAIKNQKREIEKLRADVMLYKRDLTTLAKELEEKVDRKPVTIKRDLWG